MANGISFYVNKHGSWKIERIVSARGYRWNLYFLFNDKWWHMANQGRRKTCIELADAGYQLQEIKS